MENKIYDIFIIGAGPAGMTAAIYASRANKSVAMIDKDAPGGKVLKTAEIENWTGYKTVTGPDLAVEMYQHSIAFGAKHLYGNVIEINSNNGIKVIKTDDGKEYHAKSIIIATGTQERKMGIPGEDKYYGTLISYCAVCDGALHSGKEVIVVGGGNSALEEALYLSKFTSKVTIIYRKDEFFRAEATTIDKVKAESKIETIMNATPVAVDEDNGEVAFTYKKDGEDKIIKGSCLFPFIGLIPVTDFVKDGSILTDTKYVNAGEDTKTSIEGIFVAGDVRDKKLRQIATAVGDGCVAAQEAVHYLDNLK